MPSQPDRTSPVLATSRPRPRPLRAVLRFLVTLVLAIAATALVPQPAFAASPQLGWFGSGGSNGLGRWSVGSTIVYCVDPLYGSEGGANGQSYTLGVGDWLNHFGPRHHLTATEIARINWAIHTYGTLSGSGANAKRWAAAVQLYIWSITAPDVYADPGNPAWHGGSRVGSGHGDTWFTARILLHGGSAADRTAVLERLERLRAEDNAITAAIPAVGGQVTISDRGEAGSDDFSLTHSGVPAGVSYTITLTNARFADGSTSRVFTSGGTVPIEAVMPARVGVAQPTISARLSYMRNYWPDRLRLWKPTGGQRVAMGEQLSRSYSTVASHVLGEEAARFAPELSTRAPRTIVAGERFDDLVAVTAGRIDGEELAWPIDRRTGRFLPVVVTGRLYGPYVERPGESAEVPGDAGSPVAVVRIATDPDRGPGEYSVAAEGTLIAGSLDATASGFYTWVWEIDAADQSERVRELLPDRYEARDAFGVPAETSLVPMQLNATTAVTERDVALGAPLQDELTVTADGAWLRDGGQEVPVTFRGTAYYVAGQTPPTVDPEASAIPADAQPLGTTTITVTAPGSYRSELGAVRAPDEGEGFVVWHWAIYPDDQLERYRGWVADWADAFGVEAETHRLLTPRVVTQAQPDAAIGEELRDTATVTGTVPADGAWLDFELYAAERGPEADPIWTSDPIRVTAPGDYVSPPAPGQLPGTYYWVETLRSVDDTDGDGDRIIARGEWGVPEETTVVSGPTVTTSARPGAAGGASAGDAPRGEPTHPRPGADPNASGDREVAADGVAIAPRVEVIPSGSGDGGIYDVATVTGPVPAPGAVLRFHAYRVPVTDDPTAPGGPAVIAVPEGIENGDLSWACTDENHVFTSRPVAVTEAGEYRSESFQPETHGLYLWQETLSVDLGDGTVEIHRGECGLAEESSVLLDVTTVAHTDDPTGTNPAPVLWDTAELTGWVPEGGALVFRAYRGRSDSAPVCTEESLVVVSPPIPLTGGLYAPDAPLRVTSAEWQAPIDHLSETRVYWIQQVTDALGRVVSEGRCGDPSETVVVPAPMLTQTGWATPLLTVGSAAAVFTLGGIALLLLRRRAVS